MKKVIHFFLVSISLYILSKETCATAADNSFDYPFGRAIEPGETTYHDYRKKHADEAQKKFGFKSEDVGDGMDTWHWWVGVDNPGFWRDLAKLTGSKFNYTNVRIDVLRILSSIPRADRFKRLGIINDPDCVAADKPDEFGLKIDRMKDGSLTWDPQKFGYSSGIIGLQIFKNEGFDRKKWSIEKYLASPASVEPPYKVGMACVFCHVGFDPNNPPSNPAEPKWENITSAIGNQYLREGEIFGQDLDSRSFLYQYLSTQEPGTSETSRFPTDFINNPTNINSIFRLQSRLKEKHVEKITLAQRDLIKSMYANAGIPENSSTGELGGTADAPTFAVPHILTDGADSMGVVTASVRVYVNEGMMHDQWYASWPVNPFNILDSIKRGFAPQEFDIIGKARKDHDSPWMQTERRMPNMATFLMTYESFPLGSKYRTTDQDVVRRGKIAFADHCARCHSSKIPDHLDGDPARQKDAWRAVVLKEDFLKDNYLSDDQRHPVTEIGTNAQRAEGTNAQSGSTWGQMSSQTYKDLREPRVELTDTDSKGNRIPLYNPLTGAHDLHWTGRAAYYRTPTLVSIWATAPFFHNNALGHFTGDPSIEGRLAAYKDGMEKLLYPNRRLGIKSMKITSTETPLPDLFPGLLPHTKGYEDLDPSLLMFPQGTPVNLLLNLHPKSAPKIFAAYVKGVLNGSPRKNFKSLLSRRRSAGIKAMTEKMLEENTCPDFIEDKGHTFGSEMSDLDKQALIQYAMLF